MGNISHYTKAILFFHDITESVFSPTKEQGFTLQSFRYECSRTRNALGLPYGPSRSTLLQFTLKSLPDGYLRELYQRLAEKNVSNFSIVFDASFQMREAEGLVLNDYDNAMVVAGMVVDIKEAYDVLNLYTTVDVEFGGESTHDLMTTTVQFLLQSIFYIGNNNYRKQLPINY